MKDEIILEMLSELAGQNRDLSKLLRSAIDKIVDLTVRVMNLESDLK